MPLIQPSSYNPSFLIHNRHLQTIFPSYCRKCEPIEYTRENFIAPDGDPILLDWSRKGSDKLLIINHGLCGHTRRHYALSLVKAFNDIGWDCLAWNYRGTGQTHTDKMQFTTCESTEQVRWVTEHAISEFGYKKVAFSGYSMGGNLCMLYLAREADTLPKEVIGGAFFCATIDIKSSALMLDNFMGRIYEQHFVHALNKVMIEKHKQFPDVINIDGIENVKTIKQFDDRFTAPIMGYKDAFDYWEKASACRWIHKLNVPVLVANPLDDPFLSGENFPLQAAKDSKFFYLETPEHGGHCGFITPGSKNEWWPLKRAKEFLVPLADN